MIFNTGSMPLDAIVSVAVSKGTEGIYRYKITQDVRQVIDILESILYPVLRHPQKEDCLGVYDMTIDGRDRRYYRPTEKSRVQLNSYREKRVTYSQRISQIFKETKL